LHIWPRALLCANEPAINQSLAEMPLAIQTEHRCLITYELLFCQQVLTSILPGYMTVRKHHVYKSMGPMGVSCPSFYDWDSYMDQQSGCINNGLGCGPNSHLKQNNAEIGRDYICPLRESQKITTFWFAR
jgi:hypothetical protein